jgi:hypothetical protein
MTVTPKGTKIISFSVFFLLIGTLFVYPCPLLEDKIELKISGGINYLSRTDYDASDKGWSDLRKITMESQGGTQSLEHNPLDWGGEIGGEIIFNLNSRFALSGGVGYITGKTSSKETTTLEGIIDSHTTYLTAKAFPVTVGITYTLWKSSQSRFFIGAGVGYYFASFHRTYLQAELEPGWISYDFTGSGGDVGFHGGIGFEYSVFRNIAIVIEGYGRYAKIQGFEGSMKSKVIYSNEWSDLSHGNYYYSDREQSSGKLIPRVSFGTGPPTAGDARNVREYETDFSGFAIRAGIKIKLF